MTAPVTQRPATDEGEKIEMTAPVTQRPSGTGGGSYMVGFVMPAKFTLENIPEPLDPRVKIREVPARKAAARTYAGSWAKAFYEREKKILLKAMEREGLKPKGEPVFARYNHPGVKAWERRNEVIVDIAE
jgi:hypothetical protein